MDEQLFLFSLALPLAAGEFFYMPLAAGEIAPNTKRSHRHIARDPFSLTHLFIHFRRLFLKHKPPNPSSKNVVGSRTHSTVDPQHAQYKH
ncbi:MAG: hypothetical protein ABIG61_06885 [Planctomycetota bacterium]